MQTSATKAVSRSKRAREFERGLREAGVSKTRSKLLTKKLLLLSQPERIGKLLKRGKTTNIYVVGRPSKNGKALVYREAGGGGKSVVIFVPPRAGRRRAGNHK